MGQFSWRPTLSFEREPDITEKQAEVYAYLINFICEHGYQPTQTEIAAELGVTRGAINDRLRQLEIKGYIRQPGVYQDRCVQLPNVRFEAYFLEDDE